MVEITYHKEGDYFVPDLYLEKENYENDYIIGKYGHLRLEYLKNNKKAEYIIMFMNKTLRKHIVENDKKWEQYAEDTLECAGILYKSIEQHINNKDISKKMQCRVRDLTMAYAKEWEQTVSDYYKLGVVDGFKNRNKLNDILGGKSYEQ